MAKPGDSVRARVPYTPIHKRKKLRLPGDGKIILWTIVNVENWRPQKSMPRVLLPPPMGQSMLPDVPNWAWHEYGMRVGFWRYLKTLDERKMRAAAHASG